MQQSPSYLSEDEQALLMIQPILDKIAPQFNREIAEEMLQIYVTNPEFVNTAYADQPSMIKVFHLYTQIRFLIQSERIKGNHSSAAQQESSALENRQIGSNFLSL